LCIEPEIGLHVLKAKKLVLPELRVQFESYHVCVPDIQVKGVTEMKDELAAHMHGPE
jgi:hypothetical protein